MSEYPEYFPHFINDFHKQKDFIKAFYLWRTMMDKRIDLLEGRGEFGSRLSEMSNQRELHCLFASLLDFLYMHGWQLYRTRKSGEFADIGQSVARLKDLQSAWWSLLEPEDGLKANRKFVEDAMNEFSSWLTYMPESVIAAYEKFMADN